MFCFPILCLHSRTISYIRVVIRMPTALKSAATFTVCFVDYTINRVRTWLQYCRVSCLSRCISIQHLYWSSHHSRGISCEKPSHISIQIRRLFLYFICLGEVMKFSERAKGLCRGQAGNPPHQESKKRKKTDSE